MKIKTAGMLIFGVIFVIFFLVSPVMAEDIFPVDLGALGERNMAEDINNSGNIVGTSFYPNLGFQIKDGVLQPVSGSTSGVYGINDFGQMAGYECDAATNKCWACVWTPDGLTMTLETSEEAYATGINNLGHVVGNLKTSSGSRAFFWSPEGGLQILKAYGAGYAMAINDLDQVAGVYIDEKLRTPVAVRWDTDKSLETLADPAAGPSVAYAINNLGEVAGFSTAKDSFRYATLWFKVADTLWKTVPVLPEESDSIALGINDRSQVVGVIGGKMGFFWDFEDGTIILDGLGCAGEGVKIGRIHFRQYPYCNEASDINNRGEISGISWLTVEGSDPVTSELHVVKWIIPQAPPTPNEEIDVIEDLVGDLEASGALSGQEARPLVGRLEIVSEMLEEGNTQAACGLLNAFVNQVQAQVRTGRISAGQGQALIQAAGDVSFCDGP